MMARRLARVALLVLVALGVGLLVVGVSTSLRVKGTGFREKTLYDWLALLIVPFVLSIGAWLLQRADRNAQNRIAEQKDETARKSAEERAQIDRQIAAIQYSEGRLQTYLNQMTELLLEKGLRSSAPDAEIRVVARARTLTTLQQLDGDRKGTVLSFLREANLIAQGPVFTESTAVVSLEGADFTGAVLIHAELNGVDLRGARFSHADLRHCSFNGANLERVDFRASQLYWASFDRTRLKGADFTEANLSRVSMFWADAPRADLPSADLSKPGPALDVSSDVFLHPVQFIRANLSEARFREAHLRDAKFNEADLSGASFEGSDLWRADFNKARMPGTDLSGVYLSRAVFEDADLKGASLRHAYLGAASLTGADLSDCDLSEANLNPSRKDAIRDVERCRLGRPESLSEFDIEVYGLERAEEKQQEKNESLISLHQNAASLRGAKLSGANLTGANITREGLGAASSLRGATMPDGTKHE